MSYGDGNGLVINGTTIIATISQVNGDITVAPFGMSIISTVLCDKQYEILGTLTSRLPTEVPEVELIAFLGLTDSRS